MKLLITGSEGFIGKNLCAQLKVSGYMDLLEYHRGSGRELLDQYAAECDFVFHLAGINRPADSKDFEGNHLFTSELLKSLKKHGNKAPVLYSSSTQAQRNTPYGESKKAAEQLLFEHAAETETEVLIYRLPGVFGKWCRPNYNNVVATFCDNAAKGLPLRLDDPDAGIDLVYIDDVTEEFIKALNRKANRQGDFCEIEKTYRIKVGALADMIASFRESRNNLTVADMSDALTRSLYSTYISYLAEDAFSYPLTVHADARGSFTEFLKSESGGQVSINVSKPGASKGNHWHHTKIEKILVVSGFGIVRFQKLGSEKIIEYPVCADRPEVVEIPPGYVHCIQNTGTDDMVMMIWANQAFNPKKPDTYPMEIKSATQIRIVLGEV